MYVFVCLKEILPELREIGSVDGHCAFLLQHLEKTIASHGLYGRGDTVNTLRTEKGSKRLVNETVQSEEGKTRLVNEALQSENSKTPLVSEITLSERDKLKLTCSEKEKPTLDKDINSVQRENFISSDVQSNSDPSIKSDQYTDSFKNLRIGESSMGNVANSVDSDDDEEPRISCGSVFNSRSNEEEHTDELSENSTPSIIDVTRRRLDQLRLQSDFSTDSKTNETEESNYMCLEEALRETRSPLIPLRGHALISLNRLLSRGDIDTLSRSASLLGLFQHHLREEDSFVYLSAVEALSSLCAAKPTEVSYTYRLDIF